MAPKKENSSLAFEHLLQAYPYILLYAEHRNRRCMSGVSTILVAVITKTIQGSASKTEHDDRINQLQISCNKKDTSVFQGSLSFSQMCKDMTCKKATSSFELRLYSRTQPANRLDVFCGHQRIPNKSNPDRLQKQNIRISDTWDINYFHFENKINAAGGLRDP